MSRNFRHIFDVMGLSMCNHKIMFDVDVGEFANYNVIHKFNMAAVHHFVLCQPYIA